ncbi:hypothetical protein [Kitasatospora sp. NPDC056531]|uniref:hypothetical protein n=1 Tax=Kitasatospora sp. NPDC056531 TaxID=3345856 RepID=UPI0036B2D7FB
MPDPSSWGHADGESEAAFDEYVRDRLQSDDPAGPLDPGKSLFLAHSLDQLDFWKERSAHLQEHLDLQEFQGSLKMREIEDRTRNRTFSYLCEWERRFGYSSINESIFGNYKAVTDRLLSTHAPNLVQRFNAVYRRLNEAATRDGGAPAGEELSQALTTCRRILEAVVDHVFTARPEPSVAGFKLDQPSYRSRLFEFIKDVSESENVSAATIAMAKGLHDRFAAFDKLTNKGVHAEVALRAANMCVLNTYILCGEVLLLKQQNDVGAADAGQPDEHESAKA